MLDDIFLDELVDDPEPMLVEEPQTVEENQDEDEQPPLNPSAPSEGAVRVAPKKSGIKRQYVMLNPQKVTGPRGITCIEKYFKNVKLKGKGHELSDLNTVMSHLEHWANRMYPRSKFDDVLKRLEVLGHKRPVMTQVKKIRLGMIQEPEQDSNLVLSDTENTETPAQPPTADDIFNDLLASQPTQRINTVKEITEAQRERMLQNRRLAEEKRQARLAAEAERKKRDEANAMTLQGIEFQTALLETQGSERETILARGEVVRQEECQVSESQDVLDASIVKGLDEWETSEKVDEAKESSRILEDIKEPLKKITDEESSLILNETKKVSNAFKELKENMESSQNLDEMEPSKDLNGSKKSDENGESSSSQIAKSTEEDLPVSEIGDTMEMSFSEDMMEGKE